MMEFLDNIPTIPALLIFIIGLVGLVVAVGSLREKGTEYGLKFFASWQFALQSIASVCFYLSFPVAFIQNEIAKANPGSNVTQADAAANLQWGIAIVGIVFLITALANIKKSKLVFGALYTLAQSISSLFFFLVIFGVITKVADR